MPSCMTLNVIYTQNKQGLNQLVDVVCKILPIFTAFCKQYITVI